MVSIIGSSDGGLWIVPITVESLTKSAVYHARGTRCNNIITLLSYVIRRCALTRQPKSKVRKHLHLRMRAFRYTPKYSAAGARITLDTGPLAAINHVRIVRLFIRRRRRQQNNNNTSYIVRPNAARITARSNNITIRGRATTTIYMMYMYASGVHDDDG